jgi:hypothetical protein
VWGTVPRGALCRVGRDRRAPPRRKRRGAASREQEVSSRGLPGFRGFPCASEGRGSGDGAVPSWAQVRSFLWPEPGRVTGVPRKRRRQRGWPCR